MTFPLGQSFRHRLLLHRSSSLHPPPTRTRITSLTSLKSMSTQSKNSNADPPLSHPSIFNHFALFSPPLRTPMPKFNLSDKDLSSIKVQYRKLMMVYHPDIIASADLDPNLSADKITLSHAILKDIRLRSLHCLELLGVPIDEKTQSQEGSSSSSSSSTSVQLSNEVLLDVMEISEMIEELGEAGKSDETTESWLEIKAHASDAIDERLALLGIKHDDLVEDGKADLAEIQRLCAENQYYYTILDKVHDATGGVGGGGKRGY